MMHAKGVLSGLGLESSKFFQKAGLHEINMSILGGVHGCQTLQFET